MENPQLTPLLLLLFVPLLLHILERRRARTVIWPATRFLILAPKARLQRLRLREAAILATRTCVVFAIVAAVLRPGTYDAASSGHFGNRLPRAIILIVDTSWSMEYRDPETGETSFDKARRRALERVRSAGSGDELLLVTPAGHWVAYGSSTSSNGTQVQEETSVEHELERLRLDADRFRLTEALERAAGPAATLLNHRKEVLVFSDFQSDVLVGAENRHLEAFRSALRSRAHEVTLCWIDCGSEQPRNRFLTAGPTERLAIDAYRRTRLPISFRTTAPDLATDAPRAPTVTLRVGDQIVGREEATVDASDRLTYAFRPRLPAGATLAISYELESTDGLPNDDRHYRTVNVPATLPVLVVAAPRGGFPEGDGHYLQLALYPAVRNRPPPRVPFRPDFRSALDSVDLNEYRVVFLCGLDVLRATDVSRLEDYVRAGGGLSFVGGRVPPPPIIVARLYASGRGLLPALLSANVAAPSPRPLFPADIDVTHPFLELFATPENGDLGNVPFSVPKRTATLSADARMLTTLGGSPWLIEKSFGRGSVISLSTSLTTADSDFPRRPLFVPFVHRLTRYLAGGTPAGQNVLLGEPLTWTLDEPEGEFQSTLIGPDGERHDLQVTAGLVRRRIDLRFEGTTQPGHYRMELKESAKSPRTQTFAVNLPEHESDLRRTSKLELEMLAEDLGCTLDKAADSRAPPFESAPPRPRYWAYAITAALALLFVEQALVRTYGESG